MNDKVKKVKKRPIIMAIYVKKDVAEFVKKLAKATEHSRSYVVEQILEEKMNASGSKNI